MVFDIDLPYSFTNETYEILFENNVRELCYDNYNVDCDIIKLCNKYILISKCLKVCITSYINAQTIRTNFYVSC